MEKRKGVELDYEYLESGVNINHFLVDPSIRQQGRGSEVLNQLVNEFQEEGFEYVVVNMGGGSKAKSFLETNGFEIVESSDDHITAELELDS